MFSIVALVFLAVLVLGLAVVAGIDRRQALVVWLADQAGGAAPGSKPADGWRGWRRLAAARKRALPGNGRAPGRLQLALNRAGLMFKAHEFLLLWTLAALPGLLLVAGRQLAPGLVLLAGGLLGPGQFLKQQRLKRQRQFEVQLGQALVIMANALKGGLSFLQSMDVVAREVPAPLGDEFRRALREMNLGSPVEDSLRRLVERVESGDMELVATAVLVQRQVGGDLSRVLDNITATISDRQRIRGEIKTLTSQGRLSGLIIGLLPLALAGIIAVLNPSYLGVLFKHPLGLGMLAASLAGESVGLLLIKKIVTIDF